MKFVIFLLCFSFMASATTTSCKLNDEAFEISKTLEESRSEFLFLELIRVRTVLEMGVEIPGISSASLNPEVELYFSRN